MTEDDDLRLTLARDDADDELLGEQDRAEHQQWDEGLAADRRLTEERLRDIWGPGPGDLEPLPRLPDRRWQR